MDERGCCRFFVWLVALTCEMDNGDGWETFRAVDEKNALVLGDLGFFGYSGAALFGSVSQNFRAGFFLAFQCEKRDGWGGRGPAPGVKAWNPHGFDLSLYESEPSPCRQGPDHARIHRYRLVVAVLTHTSDARINRRYGIATLVAGGDTAGCADIRHASSGFSSRDNPCSRYSQPISTRCCRPGRCSSYSTNAC